MAIYQLKTFLDIVTAIREELKIQSSDTNSLNRIRRDINIAYLDEIMPYHNWPWARADFESQIPTRYNSGTANVTQNSKAVTLSVTPSPNYKGYKFTANGFDEVYTIDTHSGTAITLKTPFNGSSGATTSFKIYQDAAALPVDCRETIEVWSGHTRTPLQPMGLQEFRRMQSVSVKAEGRPQYYSTTDFRDPDEYSTISGLPATATRSSANYVRTLVFASDVSSYLTVGNRIKVTGAGQQRYNGEYIVSSVSTTTVTYTGFDNFTESSAVDTSTTVEKKNVEGASEVYRELLYFPAINDKLTTLYVDYIINPEPLENDNDQPIIPIGDRIVLLYAALHRAWTRERNPEEAQRNYGLFQQKLKRMCGKLEDSNDKLILSPSKLYLGVKRNVSRRGIAPFDPISFTGGGSSSTSAISGTASMVAEYDSEGNLSQSSTITSTELGYLNNVSSNVQTQLDTKAAGASSATDNAFARFDLTTGKIIQNSTVVATDAGAVSGATSLDVDNIKLDGNTVSSTDTDGAVNITPNGSGRSSITRPTLVGTTASHVIINDGSGNVSSEATVAASRGGTNLDTSGSTGVAKISSGTWSVATVVNADISGSAAITKTKLATGTADKVEITDGSGNITESAITATELTYLNDFVPLTAVALADNTGSVTNVFTYTAASFEFAIVEYSIARGAGNREVGQLMIATDGSTVNMTQVTSELGTIGVTLSADIDSGSVRVRYISTSTGTAPSFKYITRRWDS